MTTSQNYSPTQFILSNDYNFMGYNSGKTQEHPNKFMNMMIC